MRKDSGKERSSYAVARRAESLEELTHLLLVVVEVVCSNSFVVFPVSSVS